jgi:hypothetical protein
VLCGEDCPAKTARPRLRGQDWAAQPRIDKHGVLAIIGRAIAAVKTDFGLLQDAPFRIPAHLRMDEPHLPDTSLSPAFPRAEAASVPDVRRQVVGRGRPVRPENRSSRRNRAVPPASRPRRMR